MLFGDETVSPLPAEILDYEHRYRDPVK
jgi:hypothetical protein